MRVVASRTAFHMAIRADRAVREREVAIPAGDVTLRGTLATPSTARGTVLFVHGSGSSRLSPRNRAVAGELQRRGFNTLLFDLLSEDEAHIRTNVFDIRLLAERLATATEWVVAHEDGEPAIGFFGASTGAAAALMVAAGSRFPVFAVVSRGGRPDLAGPELSRVHVPTLLIVGGSDTTVLALNEDAARALGGVHDLAIIPGATHLFEEPGALEQVANRAGAWFERHAPKVSSARVDVGVRADIG